MCTAQLACFGERVQVGAGGDGGHAKGLGDFCYLHRGVMLEHFHDGGTTLIGDVIESQFKTAYNPNLGAAMSLVLMILIFICVAVMNRFGEGDGEEVIKV